MHSIALFISTPEGCGELAPSIAESEIIDLPQGLQAILLFAENRGSIWGDQISAEELVPTNFQCLRAAWAESAKSASLRSVIAYCETEYFGGNGGQSAVVYENGAAVFGPTSDEAGPQNEWPINKALRCLGVSNGDCDDEFAAIGFQSVRSNEDFLNVTTSRSSTAPHSSSRTISESGEA